MNSHTDVILQSKYCLLRVFSVNIMLVYLPHLIFVMDFVFRTLTSLPARKFLDVKTFCVSRPFALCFGSYQHCFHCRNQLEC